MTDINHTNPKVVALVQQRELAVAKQAVKALRDCVDPKRQIGLPVLPETRQAIDELEGMIASLKLELLRSPHPDQLMLPSMEDLPVANEGKQQEASRRSDMAS